MIRAYMIAGTKHTLHHKCSTHCIEKPIVLRDPKVLEQNPQSSQYINFTGNNKFCILSEMMPQQQ